jgi:DNA processing protein
MDVADTRLCLLLHSACGLDDPSLARLLTRCGTPRAAWESGPADWKTARLSPTARRALERARRTPRVPEVERRLEALAAAGAVVLPLTDGRYPDLLRQIHDPPPLLYLRGDAGALNQLQLAVVGSRRASPAGVRAAATLAGQAVAAGLSICSGMALGIDAAAHRGALLAGGRSVAVMATGIDRLYPARHRELAAELERAGCLVSEFPPGVAPLRHNFPRRNRLISGLSLGVLVVEAALPSGSLITAGTALEQGREVFALPWSMFHRGGAGCLRLIRDGAKMVVSIADVLEELGPLAALQRELFSAGGESVPAASGGAAGSSPLLSMVGFEAVSIDELARASALPVARVLAELTALELQGHVARCPGGYIRT